MNKYLCFHKCLSWVGTEPTTCSAKRRITTNWAAWPVIKLLYTGLFKGKKHDTPISFIILTQHLCNYPQVRSIRDRTWSPFTLTLCRYRPTERSRPTRQHHLPNAKKTKLSQLFRLFNEQLRLRYFDTLFYLHTHQAVESEFQHSWNTLYWYCNRVVSRIGLNNVT